MMNSGQAEANEYNLKRYMERLKEEQNLPLAVAAGAGGAFIGAILWALITYFTEYQIGWMAIGVGFLVGLAVRTFGKGLNKIYGIIGAGFSLLGCLVGNYLAVIFLIAKFESVPFLDVFLTLVLSPALSLEIMVDTFQLLDLLFYGLAVYQGYRLSFRQITQEELDRALGTGAPVSF
jgi:hypothetical protein